MKKEDHVESFSVKIVAHYQTTEIWALSYIEKWWEDLISAKKQKVFKLFVAFQSIL